MFFRKKKIPEEKKKDPEIKKEEIKKPKKSWLFFNGFVEVKENERSLQTFITEAGVKQFEQYTLNELIIYLDATLNTYEIQIEANICNGAGPVSSTRSFLAYHILMQKMVDLIKIRKKELGL